MEHAMFCYQCQETAGCAGCTRAGVCGKTAEVANRQDLLIFVTRGLSAVTTALRAEGKAVDPGVDRLITVNLFTTITNANFDPDAIDARIRETLAVLEGLREALGDVSALPEAALWDGSGDWYAGGVAWASANGIVTGYGDGRFGPNDPITREQMAAILYRYAGFAGQSTAGQADLSGYTDAGQVSPYAAEAMGWAADRGLITGVSADTLAPGGSATRAQVATILMRFCQTDET